MAVSGKLFGVGTYGAILVAAVWWALATLVPAVPAMPFLKIVAVWMLIAVASFVIYLVEE